MEFEFIHAPIPDVIYIRKKSFTDNRGILIKEYEVSHFTKKINVSFLEEYVSISKQNVLRGLHFQKNPRPQGKLISVIKGHIFDVAVDIRKDSRTYLKYVSTYLSPEEQQSIWIPPGFAHGFLTLSEESIVLNRCTSEFDQTLESGLKWDDPSLNVQWPDSNPILSDKDKGWKPIYIC